MRMEVLTDSSAMLTRLKVIIASLIGKLSIKILLSSDFEYLLLGNDREGHLFFCLSFPLTADIDRIIS